MRFPGISNQVIMRETKRIGVAPLIIALAIVAAWLMGAARVSAAVTISAFNAKGQASNILVNWATGSEINNVGFNILRSTTLNGTYTKINGTIIAGCAGCIGGQPYSYPDSSVTVGQTYYYQLQSVDNSGGTQITKCVTQCPVSASAGAPAPTPTSTNTAVPPANTPTATKTPRPATATNTPRPSATKTGAAPTETLAADVLPTETLVPDIALGDYPTATDAAPDSQDSGIVETPVDSNPAPTKFAYAANPTSGDQATGPDQTETSTPTPASLGSAVTQAHTASTSVALRVQPTKVATQSHPASKSKAPSPRGSSSAALSQTQTTAVALLLLAASLFGLGLLSGLVGLFMWYSRRYY